MDIVGRNKVVKLIKQTFIWLNGRIVFCFSITVNYAFGIKWGLIQHVLLLWYSRNLRINRLNWTALTFKYIQGSGIHNFFTPNFTGCQKARKSRRFLFHFSSFNINFIWQCRLFPHIQCSTQRDLSVIALKILFAKKDKTWNL